MSKITVIEHLRSCSEEAKGFANRLVSQLATTVTDAITELASTVDHQEKVTLVTLAADGWIGTAAPYSQTVSVQGAAEGKEALLVGALEDGAGIDTQKAYAKAFGIVSAGTAALGDGTATFKVYKKPATDIVVGLKGV